ncbi:DUF4386 family protein [Adhaeribacter aquaticus]|uniref:DUF4386 family protein n=1 Tax=Adhaeribacter aquaticus TaxID=299567 RepID=UPI0004183559
MVVAGLCYLFSNLANQFSLDYEIYKSFVELIVSTPMALGELGFAIWLIWKGGKQNKLFILPYSLSDAAK